MEVRSLDHRQDGEHYCVSFVEISKYLYHGDAFFHGTIQYDFVYPSRKAFAHGLKADYLSGNERAFSTKLPILYRDKSNITNWWQHLANTVMSFMHRIRSGSCVCLHITENYEQQFQI